MTKQEDFDKEQGVGIRVVFCCGEWEKENRYMEGGGKCQFVLVNEQDGGFTELRKWRDVEVTVTIGFGSKKRVNI